MYVFDVFVWGQQQLQSLGWLASSTTPETAKPLIPPMSEEMAGVKKDIIFVLQLLSFGVCHGCLWHLCLWQVFTSPHVRMLLLLLPRMMPRHFKLPLCKHMSCEQFVSTGQFCFAGWGLTIQFSHPHSILPNWVVGFFEQWHVNILSVPFPFIKGDKKAHVFEQVPPVPCHLALISPCIQCGHDCSLLVICKYCSKLTVYLFLLRCRRNHFRRIKRLGFDLYTSTWICPTVPIRQCGLLPNIPRLLSSRVPMEHSKVQPLSCT